MDLEIAMEDGRWAALDLTELAARAGRALAEELDLPEDATAHVLATDDAHIARLNADFRGKDRPTNVLSWPAVDLAPQQDGAAPAPPRPDFDGELFLGDVALAYETCAREADEQGKSLPDHVTHLLVHGLLHLLGHDHERPGDAARMETLERAILAKLGIDDPY